MAREHKSLARGKKHRVGVNIGKRIVKYRIGLPGVSSGSLDLRLIMDLPKLSRKTVIVLVLAIGHKAALAQAHIEGTVYDRSQRFPMQGVSVMGTSGTGTITDTLGHYSIRLRPTDSLFFSYLGKVSSKIPVKEIDNSAPFDMSLDAPVDTLAAVLVGPRIYRLDSLENRRENAKLFNYDGNDVMNMKSGKSGRSFGIGLDFDMILDAKRAKRMEHFKDFLEQDEKDKYVDYRFNKSLVRRITGLESPALDSFMHEYRPSYEYIQACTTEIEFYKYILDSSRYFAEIWKLDHHAPVADSTAVHHSN